MIGDSEMSSRVVSRFFLMDRLNFHRDCKGLVDLLSNIRLDKTGIFGFDNRDGPEPKTLVVLHDAPAGIVRPNSFQAAAILVLEIIGSPNFSEDPMPFEVGQIV